MTHDLAGESVTATGMPAERLEEELRFMDELARSMSLLLARRPRWKTAFLLDCLDEGATAEQLQILADRLNELSTPEAIAYARDPRNGG